LMTQVEQARSRAEESGADELAEDLFNQARTIEEEAARLVQAEQFEQALPRLIEAQTAFKEAEDRVRVNLTVDRLSAEELMTQVEQARSRAEESGADELAEDLFNQARTIEEEAARLVQAEQFEQAHSPRLAICTKGRRLRRPLSISKPATCAKHRNPSRPTRMHWKQRGNCKLN